MIHNVITVMLFTASAVLLFSADWLGAYFGRKHDA